MEDGDAVIILRELADILEAERKTVDAIMEVAREVVDASPTKGKLPCTKFLDATRRLRILLDWDED